MMRQFLVVIHRYVGLFIAVFLIVVGLTGSIIAFDREIDRWLNPGVLTVTPRSLQLRADHLIAKVESAYPSAYVSYLDLPQKPDHAARAYLSRRPARPPSAAPALSITEVLVDPYDGRVLGGRDRDTLRFSRLYFIPWIYRLHWTLHLGDYGMWFLGAVALAWFVDSFVGLYLAWPRHSWPDVRRALTVKVHRSGLARIAYDLHRAGGIWTFLVLLVIAFSGVTMNLYDAVYHPILSLFSPLTPEAEQTLPDLDRLDTKTINMPDGLKIAEQALAGQHASGVLAGVAVDQTKGFYSFEFRTANDITADRPGASVAVLASSGAVVSIRLPNRGTGADVFDQWQLPLHSGRAFGLPGRIIICFTGLMTAMLSLTGMIIWYKKRRSRIRSKTRS